MMKNCIFLCIALYFNLVLCQKIPPGVPPQQYQQQHYQHQQQYQQPQFQQQQQQFQQPPHQQHFEQVNPAQFQQQQQQPHQAYHPQVPVQQPMGHHHGHGQPQVLNTGNIEHEKEHIAEHLDIPLDTKDMTTEQLQFYYFQMHDADKNNKLDGCELIKSLIHWHEQGSKGGGNNIEERIFKDEELVTLIDPILNMDDLNHDGYIDYPEFIQAQRKAAAAGGPPNPTH